VVQQLPGATVQSSDFLDVAPPLSYVTFRFLMPGQAALVKLQGKDELVARR
jgi:hypothetical protein